jgi:hypothetical protein
VYEVGISYSGRTYEEGKKIGWRDGVRAIWCIFKYRPRRHVRTAHAKSRARLASTLQPRAAQLPEHDSSAKSDQLVQI